MTARRFAATTLLTTIPAAFSLQGAELQPQRHNVLFIIADDLTATTISAYEEY